MRKNLYGSTACYLFKDDKILFIKFNKKWGQIYAPPGGKMDGDETPTECIIREFKEETGLKLINPVLKGISYWQAKDSGIIFVILQKNLLVNLKKLLKKVHYFGLLKKNQEIINNFQ